VVLFAGLGIGVPMLMKKDAAIASVPLPPAAQEADLCAQRREKVIRAIIQYAHDHKKAPSDLSVLRPAYLTVPAVDPQSGVPHQYRREGTAVSLSCPQHLVPAKGADG
jgi:hypothetical protein